MSEEKKNDEKRSVVEINLDDYQRIITENASLKKELEYIKLPKEDNIIVSNSHSKPEIVEEKIIEEEDIF